MRDVRIVLAGELAALVRALEGLPEESWRLPTGCPPWSVAELLAHVLTTLDRIAPALAAGSHLVWLTRAAAAELRALLLPGVDLQPLGWDDLTLVGKATGRYPLTQAERVLAPRLPFFG